MDCKDIPMYGDALYTRTNILSVIELKNVRSIIIPVINIITETKVSFPESATAKLILMTVIGTVNQ